jgi:hypothetical protein
MGARYRREEEGSEQDDKTKSSSLIASHRIAESKPSDITFGFEEGGMTYRRRI